MDLALARNLHAQRARELVETSRLAAEKAKEEFVSAAAARITADAAVDQVSDIAAAKSVVISHRYIRYIRDIRTRRVIARLPSRR